MGIGSCFAWDNSLKGYWSWHKGAWESVVRMSLALLVFVVSLEVELIIHKLIDIQIQYHLVTMLGLRIKQIKSTEWNQKLTKDNANTRNFNNPHSYRKQFKWHLKSKLRIPYWHSQEDCQRLLSTQNRPRLDKNLL
jgi:hypothetical protein